MKNAVTLLLVCLTAIYIPQANAGGKRALFAAVIERAMTRDAARDAAKMAEAKVLKKPLRVWRYGSVAEAKAIEKQGWLARTHFTPGTTAGRLPSGTTAQRQYGLPVTPEVRITANIPKGTSIIRGKVYGGIRGRGEVVPTQSLPPTAIVDVKKLPH